MPFNKADVRLTAVVIASFGVRLTRFPPFPDPSNAPPPSRAVCFRQFFNQSNDDDEKTTGKSSRSGGSGGDNRYCEPSTCARIPTVPYF